MTEETKVSEDIPEHIKEQLKEEINDNDEPVIPEELLDELKQTQTEDLFTEYFGKGDESKIGESIDFAKDWFPSKENWSGKTKISAHQAHSLSVVRNFTKVFDEVNHLDEMFDSFVTDYEIYLTSVEGLSREQQLSILKNMFGGPSDSDEEAKNMFRTMLADRMGENDE